MNTTSSIINVAPGSVLPGRLQAITVAKTVSLNDEFSVEIPGEILQCGNASLLRVLPYAKVVCDDEVVLLTASVGNNAKLGRELRALEGRLGRDHPIHFSIRLTGRSISDLLDESAKEAGCGCSGTATHSIPGQVEVAVTANKGAANWSQKIRARIIGQPIASDDDSEEGVWYWFDCRSDWVWEWGNARRRTNCEGPCTGAPECKCEQPDVPGWWRKACVHGWVSCVCH